MYATVRGVAAAPPTTGLVVSAARPDEPDDRWAGGLAWVPERDAAAYRLTPWCGDADTGYDPNRAGSVYYRPPSVEFADECSVLDGPPDRERLRRMAEANTPFVIASELWSGTLTTANPHTDPDGNSATNPHLASADATTVGGSAASVLVAIGRLEQEAGEAAGGQAIMLHLPRLLLPQLRDYVRRSGQLLLTPNDNVVVADAAYPGTGPAGETVGATAWAYATAPVAVRMTPLQVIDADPQTVDRDENTRTAWASRSFAATFDPAVHLTTEVTIGS